jgi:hypothetical protein
MWNFWVVAPAASDARSRSGLAGSCTCGRGEHIPLVLVADGGNPLLAASRLHDSLFQALPLESWRMALIFFTPSRLQLLRSDSKRELSQSVFRQTPGFPF